MLSRTERSFSLLFLTVLGIELLCGSIESLSYFRYFTKPAVLTVLILFFLRNSGHLYVFTRSFTLLALVLSLLGDILLMFESRSSYFFMAGLGSFLLAHCGYVLVFVKKRNPNTRLSIFTMLLTIYICTLFLLIKDGLGQMLIPVILYVLAIGSMAISAYARKGRVMDDSFYFVLIGAILFVISDSLIAIDRFYAAVPLQNVSIMLTYGMAQLLIVLGILKQTD